MAHEILLGTNYKFSAREVMDLLKMFAQMDETRAAAVVGDLARRRELDGAREDVQDAKDNLEYEEAKLARLTRIVLG